MSKKDGHNTKNDSMRHTIEVAEFMCHNIFNAVLGCFD